MNRTTCFYVHLDPALIVPYLIQDTTTSQRTSGITAITTSLSTATRTNTMSSTASRPAPAVGRAAAAVAVTRAIAFPSPKPPSVLPSLMVPAPQTPAQDSNRLCIELDTTNVWLGSNRVRPSRPARLTEDNLDIYFSGPSSSDGG